MASSASVSADQPAILPLDDSADYLASLERRLNRINQPAPRSSSRAVARSMLSSLAATREDHMHHLMSSDAGHSNNSAVLASFQPQTDNLGLEVSSGGGDEPEHRDGNDLGCCACCFPVYKLIFPSKVSVSRSERRRLVDYDELQLDFNKPEGDSDSD